MNLNGDAKAKRLSGLMASVVLCTTGLSWREREETRRLGHAMGAMLNDELTFDTTHLVCASVKTTKYEAAMRSSPSNRISIVNSAYIKRCHETVVRLEEAAFFVPPLLGMKISVSGFERRARNEIWAQVAQAGGCYSPTLDAEETDVLVVKWATGSKYDAAADWEIPCVSTDWLYDSIAKVKKLTFSDYLVGRETPIMRGESSLLMAADVIQSKIFDGVVAFVAGSYGPRDNMGKALALLSCGQGTCVPALISRVTHIILLPGIPLTESKLHMWVKHHNGAKIVSAAWLVASTTAQRRQSEQKHGMMSDI